MQKLSSTDLHDAGRVRFGAGMRASSGPATGLPALPTASRRPASGSSALRLPPAAVADAGRVRLGAGMRRG
ncbi:hypothetical protein E0493_06630 [Roseomonas sp. M0104]|uniref:Uncharacterized protein n=1 Tax=Teichococcus coralli TaxID=2545983 RepID=A0A845B907_9PROT|nr:hypothetical protein [Pseudoroseomonas coralli]MXP63028.1 hypothetical protein [Pseudoroseomonas coralli]